MRRICVVGSGWHHLSGISYYTCSLANALASRYEVSAVLMRRLLPRSLYPGRVRVGADLSDHRYAADIDVLDGVDWFWLPSLGRAAAFLRRRAPDALVLQWWTGTVLHTYVVLALLARARGARVVVELHEAVDTAEAARRVLRVYVGVGMRLLTGLADGFVVHSEHDREALTAHYGLHGKPVVVIPLGPFDYLDSSGPDPAARGTTARDDECRILFFGTIRPYKGLEHLVEAFSSLSHSQVQGLRLTVVGETWEGWTLPAELIARSPHRDRICFVNRYVTDTEAAAAFADASAVVLPYLRSSASGPLHLAMSHGLPVVVSGVGGLVEAATPYEGARFVRPASVEDLRQALLELPGRTGRRYEDPHSWERSVDSYAELLGRPSA